MPYVKEEHANLGYVDKPIKAMLDLLCENHGRTIKGELEFLIKQEFVNSRITLPSIKK